MKYGACLLLLLPLFLHAIKGPFLKIPVVGGPGPLFAFGQNVIPKNLLIQGLMVDHLDRKNESATGVEVSWLYGITNSLALQLSIPYVRRKKDIFGPRIHSGAGDIRLQGEYALYNKETETLVRQWTIVSTLFFPTSHFTNGLLNNLLLGRSAYTGFVGTTANTITPEWYTFGSIGSILPSKRSTHKYGAVLLYECGFGRTLYSTSVTYVAAILEVSGIKRFHDTINDLEQVNTRSNIIYLGPVLRWAYHAVVLQGGFQKPVYQKLDGLQNKREFRLSVGLACEFKF